MRYHNFILTLWQDGEPQANAPPLWRYSLEYPSTGERHGFKHTDELLRFIKQWTVSPPPTHAAADQGGETTRADDV